MLLFFLFSAFAYTQTATPSAGIPRIIKFSGTTATGVATATFAFYGAQDAADPLWSEIQTIIPDASGHFTVLVGSGSPQGLPAEIFDTAQARWLGVKVGDAAESPRTLLVSVPYALKAADAETLGGKPLSAFVLAEPATRVTPAGTSDTPPAPTAQPGANPKRLLQSGTSASTVGTLNHLAKFMSDGVTLGDSGIVEFNGNLGVGTSSPHFPFELVGSNVEFLQRNPDPSSYSGMRFYNDQNSATRALEIDYSGSVFPGVNVFNGPTGESASVATTGPYPLTFGTNNTMRMTIGSTGNVGIGTTTPRFPIELVGSNVEFLQRNPDPSSYSGMRFYNDQNNALRALEIDYSGSAFAGVNVAGGPIGESASLATTGPFPMTLGTNNSARVIITGAGNVGIGTIAPIARLDVSQPASGIDPATLSTGSVPPAGIHGDTTTTSGAIAGVLGTTSSVDGYGIFGENLATGANSGFSAGVRGITANTAPGSIGTGVWGDALQTDGDNVGVFGRSASRVGTGVFGQSTSVASGADTNGVYGLAASNGGAGVFGEVTATASFSSTLFPVGVYGKAATAGAAGLFDVGGPGANILVGRNGTTNVFRVDSTGKVFADGNVQASGADFAESVSVADGKSSYEPGDVISIDTTGVRRFTKSLQPYSTLVAGIYSTKPGVLATPHTIDDPRVTSEEIPLAVVGIVPCKVTNENGDINTGDLLVTSSTAGYAMKGTDRSKMTGAVVGKALQSMHAKNGVIEVLVSLQ